MSVGAVGDGATAGTDYQAVAAFTVTVPAGRTSGTGTFTLTPEQDEVRTRGSRLERRLGDGDELTLTDDDTASTGVTLSVAPESVGEDAGATAVVGDGDAGRVGVGDGHGGDGVGGCAG